MGRRTGVEPDASHSMIERICHALDMSIDEFAATAGVDPAELRPLIDPRLYAMEWAKDDTWWKIKEHVDRQLGMLMAISADLSRNLQKDRIRQATRYAIARARQKRSLPRS